MNPYAILSLVASVLAFYTATFIYYRNPKSRLNLLVSGLGVAVSLMSFTEFMYRIVETASGAYPWLKLSLLWPVIPALLLHISLFYSGRLRRWMTPLIYLPAVILIIIGLGTDLLIAGAVHTYYGWTYSLPENPTVFFLFSLWTLAVTLIAAGNALKEYTSTAGPERRETFYLFCGLFIPLIISFSTDFIVRELMAIPFPELTQTMLTVGLIFISYGIWKYDFPLLTPALAADRIMATVPSFLMITDLQGRITAASRSVQDKLRYGEDELRGRPAQELFSPSDREMMAEVMEAVDSAEFESTVKSADGRELEVIVTISPIMGRMGEAMGFVVSAADISLQKKATARLIESELRFRGVVERISDGIALTDESGTVIYWNRALEGITSIRMDDALGRNIHDLCRGLVEETGDGEFLLDGRVVSVSGFSVRASETLRCLLVRDVTESRSYEESLRRSLREKETLLREIHHRVKNNLQIISSLLNLQKGALRDEEDVRLFEESQNRIRSMAMIHESLYQSETLLEINLKEYMSRLAVSLISSYGASGVGSEVETDDLRLDIERALPLALIMNELITNSLKYAFPDDRGLIKIRIHSDNGECVLEYSDDGVGLPEDYDPETSDSLGMTLVRSLGGQLDAEFEVDGKDGFRFRMKFPCT